MIDETEARHQVTPEPILSSNDDTRLRIRAWFDESHSHLLVHAGMQ